LYFRKMVKVDSILSFSACFMIDVLFYRDSAGKAGIGYGMIDFLGEGASAAASTFTSASAGGGGGSLAALG
jgi:hypothetical protein